MATNSQNIQQQQQLQPLQEDFYLLDVVGGTTISALHPSRPVVAYSTGCMIIIHDMMTDQKINLVHHQHEIYALAFSSPGAAGLNSSGGDYLVSIDFDRNDLSDTSENSSSTMCLWNWQRGQCLQELPIPKSQHNSTFLLQPNMQANSSTPRFLSIVFEKVGSNFLVLESASVELGGGGYRATLWQLSRHQKMELLGQMELELQASCLGVSILPRQNQAQQLQTQTQQFMLSRLRFLTLERQCVKLWDYSQGHAELTKRIMLKQTLKQCIIADLTGFLLILGDNGKLLILDQDGTFVSTIAPKTTGTQFTVIGTAHDKLLLGTDRGTVCVYHMASLAFVSEVPYQLSVLQNFQLNAQYHHNQSMKSTSKSFNPLADGDQDALPVEEQFSVFRMGPPVVWVGTTHNMRFLMIRYQDSSFVLIDRSVQTPSQAVMGYSFGHFQSVRGIEWLSAKGKSKYGKGTDNGQAADTFITCSQDMSIFVWRHFGDRWSFSYIDTVKCFDAGLSFSRKLVEKSTQGLGLGAVSVYPRSQMVIVGDTKGVVRIFQLSTQNDKAMFVASHQLMRGQEYGTKDDSIVEIHITQDEQYAIIAFESGLICCYDIKNSFTFLGQIEKDAQRFCYSNQLQVQVKVIENIQSQQLQSFSPYDILRTDDKMLFGSQGLSGNSFETGVTRGGAFTHSFRVISTTSPNCVSLRSVEVRGHKLFKTPLAQFLIDEGKVAGFDLHPSQDYLLITSTAGKIYVFRLDTGELRGTIKTPIHARGCLIDPSGLYVLIKVPPFKQKYTNNLIGTPMEVMSTQQNSHENDIERTTLLMYEIGTGQPAAEIKSIFEVSSMKFSEDGKYLSLGSNKGTVCVWAVGDHLYQNIKQVLDSVQIQSDFWCNYPIFLPDYGQPQVNEFSPPMLNVNMPVETQFDRPEQFQMTPTQVQQPPQYGYPQVSQRISNIDQMSSAKNTLRSYSNAGMIIPPQQFNQQTNQGIQAQLSNPTQYQGYSQRPNQQQQNYQQRTIERGIQQSDKKANSLEKQQQKFYRKTFVEDRESQITKQHINQHHPSGRSAQIQTTLPFDNDYYQPPRPNMRQQTIPAEIPDYQDSQRRPMIPGSYRQQLSSKSSQASPNKAELLYQDAYLGGFQERSEGPTFRVNREEAQVRPLQSYQQMHPQPKTFSEPKLDFIDKTLNDRLLIQTDLQGTGKTKGRQIFFDDQADGDNGLPGYEENMEPAHLFTNPFRTNQSVEPNMLIQPMLSSIDPSPHKSGRFTRPQTNPSELQRVVAMVGDPVDIDDDVSDHGPESIEQQLKELDGMNKYMQHIRVPTRFASDDFIMVNGNKGGEPKSYTLERMRQEQRMMEGPNMQMLIEADERSDRSGREGGSSTYEVVEDMYENMNQFDLKMKSMRQQSMY